MSDAIDTGKSGPQCPAIPHVRDDEVDVRAQVLGPAVVDLRVEGVEYPDLMAAGEKGIDDMRSDEPGTPGDEHVHRAAE